MDSNGLVDAYLRHIGMRRIQGDGFDVILPFFMLDSMYQIMSKDIVPVKSKQEQKLALKRWQASYNAFNQDFFRAFNPDQQDEIIDMMDAFGEYINNDVIVAKVSVMKELTKHGIPFEQQKVVASCLICHILAQTAQITWGAIYKNSWGQDKENIHIKGILKHSWKWLNLYFASITDAYVNPNESEQICTSVDILCKRMIKFIKQLKAA